MTAAGIVLATIRPAPAPTQRRLGVRTAGEIDEKRNALKALRGDYQEVPVRGRDGDAAGLALSAAER
jgi:hypothetical protein